MLKVVEPVTEKRFRIYLLNGVNFWLLLKSWDVPKIAQFATSAKCATCFFLSVGVDNLTWD
jgi:hypothetical protein